MAKQQFDRADQFYTISDKVLRGYLVQLADQIEEQHRQEIWATYNDPELASIYRGMRVYNDLNEKGFTKQKTLREVVRLPAGPIYHFLRSIFQPIYGYDWLKNKKVLNHELVKPFWIVSKI
jgi:hypothetical protein